MRLRSSLALSILACLAATACVDDVDPGAAAADGAPVSDDTVFFETVVTTGPDGTPSVEEHPITAGEERAQNAARDRIAAGGAQPLEIVRDNYCSYTSFWLYDRTDFTGNRLCLYNPPGTGAGYAFLSDFTRYICRVYCIPSSWAISSGSYKGGNQTEWLRSNSGQDFFVDPYTSGPFVVTSPFALTTIDMW